jgi:hypothetical protein
VLVFLVVALTTAVTAGAFGDVDKTVTSFGSFTGGKLELAVLLGALAYAGAGGTNNLVVSNWIRDKGFGMGLYAPRVVSPITGEDEAAPSGRGYVFRVDPLSMVRSARVVAQGEHRAVRDLLRDRRADDRRVLARRVLDGVRQPGREGGRLQLHPDRGQRAQGRDRRLVRDAVLGDRRDQPVRRGARDHRLRQPAGRRRAAGRLPAPAPALDREPSVLRRRLDADRVRHRDPALGLRSAAVAGRGCRGAERRGDVHQPPVPARSAEGPRAAAARAAVGRRPVRRDVRPRRDQRGERAKGDSPPYAGNSGSSRMSSKSGSPDAHSSTSGAIAAAACRCPSAASRRPATASKQAAL